MAEAKIVIKGENKIGSAVKGAEADLSKLSSALSTLKATALAAFSLTAIKKTLSTIKLLTADFDEARRSYAKMSLALGDSYDAVVDNINKLTRLTLSSKSDIEALASKFASLGKSADEVNKLLDASVALSTVTGNDLNSTATTLLNTYNGNITALKKLGVNLDGVTASELKQGKAIDVVIESFSKYTEKVAEHSVSQSLKNISTTWGDIKEKIGGILDYEFGPFIENLDIAFAGAKENIENVLYTLTSIFDNLPLIASKTFNAISQMLSRTFSYEGLKEIIGTAFENIATYLLYVFSLVFQTIPKLLYTSLESVSSYIVYIAASIENSFLGAIENIINKGAEKIEGTWLGKLVSGKRVSIPRVNAEWYRENSAEKLTEVIKGTVTAIKDFKGFVSDLKSPDLYGDILEEFADSLKDIIQIDDIKSHADAMLNGKNSARETPMVTPVEDDTVEEPQASLFSLVSDSFLSSISSVVKTIETLINPTELLLTVVKSFSSTLAPLLETVISPIMDALSSFGVSLADLLIPALDVLYDIFSVLGNTLSAVFLPVINALSPAFSILKAVLEILSPIITLITKAFVVLLSPVQYVADLLKWLGSWISYLGSCIGTAIYNIIHPFSKKSYSSSPGAFSSDAFSGLSDRLATLESSASLSSSTAVTSASYTGGNTIHVNIYQNSPVVGESGMREFAKMIREELRAMDYYGV